MERVSIFPLLSGMDRVSIFPFGHVCIGSYPNLRDVQPNPLPERAARGQGMTAVHPADEGLEPRSPMHLRTMTKNGSYMI